MGLLELKFCRNVNRLGFQCFPIQNFEQLLTGSTADIVGFLHDGGKGWICNFAPVKIVESYHSHILRHFQPAKLKLLSQSLEFTPGGDTSPYKTTPIIHRGNVYFTCKGAVYSVPLGEEIDNATAIWGEESGGSNSAVMVVDPNALQCTPWADGDHMYFLANIKQSNGTYKVYKFLYNTKRSESNVLSKLPILKKVEVM